MSVMSVIYTDISPNIFGLYFCDRYFFPRQLSIGITFFYKLQVMSVDVCSFYLALYNMENSMLL